MDEQQASRNPLFGGRVAHGYFLVSAAAGLFVDPAPAPVLANYGLERLRFTKPVFLGDAITVALTVEEIEAVMGGPAKPPIRVFVGLETKATTSERADMARLELETLGAFERKHIVFMSPTGTGYLNYVTAESLEEARRLGLVVSVWTPDSPEDLKKLIEMKVDAITTNRPDVIKKLLAVQ